jgi:hypothetical protein
VLHVIESDVVAGEGVVDLEEDDDAVELLHASMSELREAGVPVAGEVLHSYGTHADVGDQILRRAAELGAGAIVIGPHSRDGALGSGVTAQFAAHADVHVVVLHTSAGALGRPHARRRLRDVAATRRLPASPDNVPKAGAHRGHRAATPRDPGLPA